MEIMTTAAALLDQPERVEQTDEDGELPITYIDDYDALPYGLLRNRVTFDETVQVYPIPKEMLNQDRLRFNRRISELEMLLGGFLVPRTGCCCDDDDNQQPKSDETDEEDESEEEMEEEETDTDSEDIDNEDKHNDDDDVVEWIRK